MLGDFGSIMKLLGNRDKIQAEVAKLQESLGTLTAEGNAGGGLVTVRVNGRMEVLTCRLLDDALNLNDRAALEDLIVEATNSALAKARAIVAGESQKMAQTLGIPANLMKEFGGGLPGLG